MSKEQKFPYENLREYCRATPDKFETKEGWTLSNIIYTIVGIAFVILVINPMLINTAGIGFRIIYGLIAAFALYMGLTKDTIYINRRTGNKMKELRFRKYKLEGENDMDDIVQSYENEDYEAMSEVPTTSDGSLRVQVLHDKEGKLAILMLSNEYYGDVNYISEVRTFEGAKYDEYIRILKRI